MTYPAGDSLLRLPQVLELIPVSKSAWWRGCRDGRSPKPVKLGPRTTAWRSTDIAALIRQAPSPACEEQAVPLD